MDEATMEERYANLVDVVDFTSENAYFSKFLAQEGIQYLNLLPKGRRIIRRDGLEWPYFSLECDMHFSTAGHDLLYDAVKGWN